LLKAGLVDEQQIKRVRSSKRKQGKQDGGRTRAETDGQRRAQQAAAEKARRDSELSRQRREEARRKAEANELRQLIHTNRIPRGEGDIAYSFLDSGSIKRIYVTADQQQKLAKGNLAIVRQDTGFEARIPRNRGQGSGTRRTPGRVAEHTGKRRRRRRRLCRLQDTGQSDMVIRVLLACRIEQQRSGP